MVKSCCYTFKKVIKITTHHTVLQMHFSQNKLFAVRNLFVRDNVDAYNKKFVQSFVESWFTIVPILIIKIY